MSVSLAKGQSVSLEKKNNTYSNVSINLRWNKGKPAKGFFGSLFGGEKNIDLDLGCLYEMKNGQKGAVQALGNLFGNLNNEPFMQLANDDRTGESKDGEFLTINGAKWSQIERVLVYAFIYEGISAWSKADGIIHLKSDVSEIDIALDNPTDGQTMCAIALIENVNGQMKVTKLNDYYQSHEPMDRAYSWNLNWVAGSK